MNMAYVLYKKHTVDELLQMDKDIRSNPSNHLQSSPTNIYLYTKSAREKLANIAWAITYHMIDKAKDKDEQST